MRKKMTASQKCLRPDPKYHSLLVSKFVNCLMLDGKKSVAQRIVYRAMEELKKRSEKQGDDSSETSNELEIFTKAIDNVKPAVEIQSKRVGGATYQVPMKVSPERQQALSFRWILEVARNKKGRPMHLKLADEFMAAYRREGEAMSKRENVHRMADANKAFAHFAH